jgi:hypothetical protein
MDVGYFYYISQCPVRLPGEKFQSSPLSMTLNLLESRHFFHRLTDCIIRPDVLTHAESMTS